MGLLYIFIAFYSAVMVTDRNSLDQTFAGKNIFQLRQLNVIKDVRRKLL